MELYFASLGCDKNLVDTEHMMGVLTGEGYDFTSDPAEADVIIINTCCFILDAKQESIDTILELAEYKKTGRAKALIVAGCLGERYRDELLAEMPEVDAVVGALAWEEIGQVLKKVSEGERPQVYKTEKAKTPKRVITTPGGHSSYLKIAEGCNKACSYCIIPKIRGPYRSVPMEELLEEAETLAAAGVKELCLVAQETSLYGTDLYGEKKLPVLLDRLNAIEGLKWIRILYCYPEEIDERLIDAMLRNDKVCHYLDMPIQHCEDRILKAMGRRTDKADITKKIRLLRERIPDICLRTTLITGFPGETEEEFEALLAFVEEAKFDRLGCFPYSAEEGTRAAEMDGQLPEDVKAERADRVMALAKTLSLQKNKERLGSTETVIVEGYLPEDEVYVGRTYRDTPEIDNYVFFESPRELMTGTFLRVAIEGADEYDLIGAIADESAE